MQDTFLCKPILIFCCVHTQVLFKYVTWKITSLLSVPSHPVEYTATKRFARSHCFFHQVEGLYIDKNVSFADLKQTLQYFTTELFGKSKIRLRPSYFPFTEPSAEVDVYWGLETQTDYKMTKGTGWLEIMGCGMVDPNVLKLWYRFKRIFWFCFWNGYRSHCTTFAPNKRYSAF